MEDIRKISLKNKEYIFIDTYIENRQIIYHFGCIEDEIFCYKENGEYVQIEDNFKLSLIKNKYGLTNEKVYYNNNAENNKKLGLKLKTGLYSVKYKRILKYIDDLDRENIILEQKENFKNAKEKLGIDLDLDVINNIIDSVTLFKSKNIGRFDGIYYYKYNNIQYKENIIRDDEVKSKRVRFHEYVHSITGGRLKSYHYSFLRGISEGETENLVEDLFDGSTSSTIEDIKDNNVRTMRLNISKDCSYDVLVTIVKQMEHALGIKSYKSILNGSMEFEKQFIKEYGIQLMTFIAYRTRRLYAENKLRHSDLNKIDYFKQTQDILMKKVFDKDLTKVESLEDAKKYMKKLREFETTRGKIEIIDNKTFEEIEDPVFEEYYNQKYEEIFYILQKRGLSREQIDLNLKEYAYQKQQYKPEMTEQVEQSIMKETFMDYIIASSAAKQIKLNQYDLAYCKNKDDNSNIFFILEKDSEKGYHYSIKRDNYAVHINDAIRNINRKLQKNNIIERICAGDKETINKEDYENLVYISQDEIVKQIQFMISQNEEMLYDNNRRLLAKKELKSKEDIESFDNDIRGMNNDLFEMIKEYERYDIDDKEQIESQELEKCKNEKKFTFRQKIAQFLQKNNMFVNSTFIENFIHKQLDLLPSDNPEIKELQKDSKSSARDDFETIISNNTNLKNLQSNRKMHNKENVEEILENIRKQDSENQR